MPILLILLILLSWNVSLLFGGAALFLSGIYMLGTGRLGFIMGIVMAVVGAYMFVVA